MYFVCLRVLYYFFKSIYDITTGDEDCGLTNSTMTTAHLGTLNSFNPTDEPITSYLERVQLFFAANSVSEGKQVPTFISIVGPATYAILRDLLILLLHSQVLSHWLTFSNASRSPRELPLWSATTFTKERSTRRRDCNSVRCSSSQTRNTLSIR